MDAAAIGSIIGGVCTGGAAIYVKIVKPAITKQKQLEREKLKMIRDIHNELRFNGGGSVKDAIFDLKETTKRINYRLGEIEENQKIAMNLQGLAFWNSNAEGECIYASPALCKIMGRSESEIKGNNWAAWLVFDDKKRIYDAWQFSVKTGSPFDEIYTFQKPDGEEVKVWGLAFHKRIDGEHLGTLGKLVELKNE